MIAIANMTMHKHKTIDRKTHENKTEETEVRQK